MKRILFLLSLVLSFGMLSAQPLINLHAVPQLLVTDTGTYLVVGENNTGTWSFAKVKVNVFLQKKDSTWYISPYMFTSAVKRADTGVIVVSPYEMAAYVAAHPGVPSLPNTQIAVGTGTSLTSHSDFTYTGDVFSAAGVMTVDADGNIELGGSNAANVDIVNDLFGAKEVIIGDNGDLVNGIYTVVDITNGVVSSGDVIDHTNGLRTSIDVANNVIKSGDVDDLSNGTELKVDVGNNTVQFGDIDEVSGEMYEKIDNNAKTIIIGHHGPGFVSDGMTMIMNNTTGSQDILMGDIIGITGETQLDINATAGTIKMGNAFQETCETVYDVTNMFIATGDIVNEVSGVKEKIDVQNGVYMAGDPDSYSSGLELMINEPSAFLRLGDRNDINNGNQLGIDDANNNCSLGDIDDLTAGLQVSIDNSAQTLRVGDVDDMELGSQIAVEAATGKITVGDYTQYHNGTNLVVDDSHSIITMSNAIAFGSTQFYVSGSTVQIPSNVRRLVVDPTGLLSSLTIKTAASPVEGQEWEIVFGGHIVSGNVVSSLSFSSGSGAVITKGSLSNVATGTIAHITYSLGNTYINVN